MARPPRTAERVTVRRPRLVLREPVPRAVDPLGLALPRSAPLRLAAVVLRRHWSARLAVGWLGWRVGEPTQVVARAL